MRKLPALASLLGSVLLNPAPTLHAAPFVPDRDGQILEHLPTATDAASRALRAKRQALSHDPGNLEQAVALAQTYIKLGKAEADPRYYGYAQGVLSPWWDSPEPPAAVLLGRALILQNRHEFDAALQDLDKLVRLEPGNAQAWLARAVVLQVRGRYGEARESCLPLLDLQEPLVAITCLSQVMSLAGQAAKSYALLDGELKDTHPLSTEQALWSYTVLAEMAVRMGNNAEADEAFKQALAANGKDAYLLSAYADFLLDQHRPAEVVALLADKTRIDGLLLRLALAKQQIHAAELPELIASLQARFDASRQRGESLHQGDEAKFHLLLLGQPKEALALAKANWQAQREPKDARILLEAALAAQDKAAAQPVLEMLGKTGMEYQALRELAGRLQK